MSAYNLILFIIAIVSASRFVSSLYPTEDFVFTMPPVIPALGQTYVCTAMELPRDKYIYLMDLKEYIAEEYIGFIHHIQPYSCQEPGYVERDSPEAIWNCGESDDSVILNKAPVCRHGFRSLPKIRDIHNLPDYVGIKAGGDTELRYLVLQLHYGNVHYLKAGTPYEIGLTVKTLPHNTPLPVKPIYSYALVAEGTIPSKETVYMECACEIEEDTKAIHPIGFMAHTHGLGLQVAGYVQKANGTWIRLGITPENNTNFAGGIDDKALTIVKGDVVASRCVMYNFRDYDVVVGTQTKNEMCNFFFLYYTDDDREITMNICGTLGPPQYYWDWDIIIKDIPQWVEQDASQSANRVPK